MPFVLLLLTALLAGASAARDAPAAPTRPRRIVMSSLGMMGHLQSLIPIAHELMARGEDVLWLAPDSYTNHLLEGIPTYVLRGDVYTRGFERDLCTNASHFAEIGDQMSFVKLAFEKVMFKNFAEVYRDAKQQIDRFKPDVVLVDFMSFSVLTAAMEADVAIVINQPVMPNVKLDFTSAGNLGSQSAYDLQSPFSRLGRWLENQMIFNFDIVGHYVLDLDALYASIGLVYRGFDVYEDSGVVIHPTYIGFVRN